LTSHIKSHIKLVEGKATRCLDVKVNALTQVSNVMSPNQNPVMLRQFFNTKNCCCCCCAAAAAAAAVSIFV